MVQTVYFSIKIKSPPSSPTFRITPNWGGLGLLLPTGISISWKSWLAVRYFAWSDPKHLVVMPTDLNPHAIVTNPDNRFLYITNMIGNRSLFSLVFYCSVETDEWCGVIKLVRMWQG